MIKFSWCVFDRYQVWGRIGFKTLFLTLGLMLFSLEKGHTSVLSGDFYSQTTYLHKFQNPIFQSKLTLKKKRGELEFFSGFYLDHDRKTDASQVYTDAQISPLVGLQSKVFGTAGLYSRFFLEGRYIHRTKSFTDERARETYELKSGLLGYGMKTFASGLFTENYYSLFFSRLYGEKVIAQGWARQGYQVLEKFHIFNEIFFDTFDQTRERDGTLDLRPGVRYSFKLTQGTIQVLHQYLHHFTNLAFAGRNEHRSTLVIGFYF